MTGTIRVRLSTGEGDVEEVIHEACTLTRRNGRFEVRRLHDGALIADYHEAAVMTMQVTE
jgi:hypothetical protein